MIRVMDKAELKEAIKSGKPVVKTLVASSIPVVGHEIEENLLLETGNYIYATNRARGKNIERDLDQYLKVSHGGITGLDYNDVIAVQLRKGPFRTTQRLIIDSAPGKRKFLINGSFAKYTGSPTDSDHSFTEFLADIFGERFSVK